MAAADVASYTAASQGSKAKQNEKETAAARQANRTSETAPAAKKSRVTNGRTIGSPELSEKAQKYYDQLRKKYGNMDFILVSEDMKNVAKANAASYANANKMVVLIDTDKIERMAEDEEYRAKYEAIIGNATTQLSQMKSSLGVNAGSVKGYGMQVNSNGTSSFFAVVDSSLKAQKKRIEEKAAQKKEDRKKADKKEAKERAEEKRAEKTKQDKEAEKAGKSDQSVTVTASTIEELVQKINDVVFEQRSNSVRTEDELAVGQGFDFSI